MARGLSKEETAALTPPHPETSAGRRLTPRQIRRLVDDVWDAVISSLDWRRVPTERATLIITAKIEAALSTEREAYATRLQQMREALEWVEHYYAAAMVEQGCPCDPYGTGILCPLHAALAASPEEE